jgi:hypothetical protein
MVPSNSSKDITIPSTGLAGVKLYAKYGCDSTGSNCSIGNRPTYIGGGNTIPCEATGPCQTNRSWCSPPANSLLEFDFAPVGGTTNYLGNNIDGVTVPYSLSVSDVTCKSIDAQRLTLSNCPTSVDLSYGGVTNLNGYDLTKINLKYTVSEIDNTQIIGCLSPCQYLNHYVSNASAPTTAYCCIGMTDEQCQAGVAGNNSYVDYVNAGSPDSYSNVTPDTNKTFTCRAGGKIYTATFYQPK